MYYTTYTINPQATMSNISNLSPKKIAARVLLCASARVSDMTDVFTRDPERQQLRNQEGKRKNKMSGSEAKPSVVEISAVEG